MVFRFRERHQLKLLREIMKKYQLDNKIYGNRISITFRQKSCLINFMNIQAKLDLFRVKTWSNLGHLMCSKKKKMFRKLFKSLNFPSKMWNL